MRKIGQVKKGEEVIGGRHRAKIVKNKVAPPFQVAEFDIMYAEGISLTGDLVDLGVEEKIVAKTGNSYTFGAHKLGLGRESAKQFLRENQAVAKEIREKIIAKKKEV